MPDMVARPDVVRDNPNVPKYHSNFQLKEVRMTTEQFGLVKPHFVIDDVSSDDFDYRPDYRTRSYTLKAPLMQDIHRKLDYVKVDLAAILPLNFEKFYTNPVQGDDVPGNVGTCISNGYDRIFDAVDAVLTGAFTAINGANNFTAPNLTRLFKSLIFGELFYSRGCLLSSLGCHISSQFSAFRPGFSDIVYSYDEFFDFVIGNIFSFLTANSCDYLVVSIDGKMYNVAISSAPTDAVTITPRAFLNEIRDTGDWSVQYLNSSLATGLASDFSITFTINGSYSNDAPFNYGRVCAYQLACAEYMTNDKVDHIYSAELYRQYIDSLLRAIYGNTYPYYFTYNGYSYQYDSLSSKSLDSVLLTLFNGPGLIIYANYLQYFISLFGYRRSLRYKDYFVSSRVRPLAVGSVDVAVNNNAVSVIDISKNIQMQRFLNAVNHSGRRLSNYIKTFFGVDVQPDRHQPHYLAQIDEMVYTSEVENTGAAQQTQANSVTATFTGNSGNKMLHFYADLPGYIIGLTSYDIERAYVDTIDRSFFIQDRFDMFLPEMQFVGDQPVYRQELDCKDVTPFGTAFGYQYRDMQYKLLYSNADGGFVNSLPGYAFMFKDNIWNIQNINPDFIRSKVSELDEYYLSLTGYSLGTYFHFISIITNNVSAKRPMIANPKILE